MRTRLRPSLALAALLAAGPATAEVTFYELNGFRGRSFTATREVRDFSSRHFDNLASSVVVGPGRWEICEKPRFEGRCAVLREGGYDSLAATGLQDSVSSVRPAGEPRRGVKEVSPAMAVANYPWRRRANERLYEAQVMSVRAVMGTATAHCWTERQTAAAIQAPPSAASPPRVLGHQAATSRNAVAGHHAVAGKSRRCPAGGAGTQVFHWDAIYSYRGVEHQVQLSGPPGKTIDVNLQGEPRQ